MKNYQDQIKSPLWQKKRLDILNLRGFKCEECSCETKQLHVHHRFYIKGRKIYEYDNDVFQILCEDCHKKVHEKKDNNIDIPKNILDLLPKLCDKETNDIYFIDDVLSFNNDGEFWSNINYLITNTELFNGVMSLINDKRDIENLKFKINMIEKYLHEFPTKTKYIDILPF